ncbi:MAG: SRPBCC domain-containing protein [Vicinamibacterales bacterium]
MTALDHQLDRTILIEAPPGAVFKHFTDPARWAAWWGVGSTIDARPGGAVFIRYPDGTEVSGAVVEVTPPSHIVFTYGYVKGSPIAAGASRVTIRLEPVMRGTRLHLLHAFAEAAVRDQHVQGWRYQLSLFANVVADETHGDPAVLVDAWFAAWAEPHEDARNASLRAIATDEVRMRDRFSSIDGLTDLSLHIGAAQRFMPGMRLQRQGDARHCQGTVIAAWSAAGPDGAPRGQGTNVFTLGPDGRIESVTGFWS